MMDLLQNWRPEILGALGALGLCSPGAVVGIRRVLFLYKAFTQARDFLDEVEELANEEINRRIVAHPDRKELTLVVTGSVDWLKGHALK